MTCLLAKETPVFLGKRTPSRRVSILDPYSASNPFSHETDLYAITLAHVDEAKALFKSGFSCSQAICAAFAEDYGIDRGMALKLSCGFGAGMARSGNTCGAVTVALMVIGMKYGRTMAVDVAARDRTYAVVQAFMAEFLRRYTSVNCTDLIGYNLKNPEEYEQARAENLFHTRCAQLVHDASQILESVL